MDTTNMTKEYTLDASGKKLGRFASEIAVLLIGKNEPNYQANVLPNVLVYIENVEDIDISQKKSMEKKYLWYSGYPGGQKSKSLDQVREGKGVGEVLKKDVYVMLPINKLRKERMKKLIIK